MSEEVKAALCASYKGLGVDEIEAEILASKHAEIVGDQAHALAEYIVELCASY